MACAPDDDDVCFCVGWAFTVTVLQVRSGAEEGVLSDSGTLVLKVLHSWYESGTSPNESSFVSRLCFHLCSQ